MARRLHPELPRRNLHALADYYAITPDRWHRAGSDAQATAEIFVRFLARLREEGIANWGCLQAFLRGEFPEDGADGDGKAKKATKASKKRKQRKLRPKETEET